MAGVAWLKVKVPWSCLPMAVCAGMCWSMRLIGWHMRTLRLVLVVVV